LSTKAQPLAGPVATTAPKSWLNPFTPFTVSSTCHDGALAGVVAAHPAEATAKPAADAREMLSKRDEFLKTLRFIDQAFRSWILFVGVATLMTSPGRDWLVAMR